MTFSEFSDFIKEEIKKGTLKTSEELTDFDIAVTYAIGEIGQKKGYPCDITPEEIWKEIYRFSPETLKGIKE